MDGSSKANGQHFVWKVTTLIKEGKTNQRSGLNGMPFASVFGVLLPRQQRPMTWLYGRAEEQW